MVVVAAAHLLISLLNLLTMPHPREGLGISIKHLVYIFHPGHNPLKTGSSKDPLTLAPVKFLAAMVKKSLSSGLVMDNLHTR